MTSRVGSDGVLGLRALNRATLERQMLLRRGTLSAEEAVEHLVGMQAQAPNPPYVGLWTRLEGFHPDQLACLILERRAVRVALMRNTVHLVSARDCLNLRPLVQPVIDRGLYANRANREGLEGVDLGALSTAGRQLLEERPRTAKELGVLLRERWPERDPALDGYIAGPNGGPQNPRAIGSLIHRWAYDLASWRESSGLAGGQTNRDDEIVKESNARVGAYVMGRRMFDE